jgi:HlyD family secretion protein
MKKILSLLFFTSLPIILSSCGDEEAVTKQLHYETFTTQAGTITLRDSIIASVEWGTTSDLAFKNGGRITEILVHPGDQVKKWQILARLGNNESDIMVDWLSQVAGGLSQVQVSTESMRAQTEAMKLSIEKLYDERIAQSENGIKQLKNELLKNEKNLTDNIDNLDQNYVLQLNNIINLANTSLHEWDKILGMTSNFEYTNDGWEDYLGTRVWDSRSIAENAWGKLYGTIGELRALKEKNITITAENAKTYIEKIESSYDTLRDYHEKMVYMLENSVLGAWLSPDLRDGWTMAFNTFKSSTSEIEWVFIAWKWAVTWLLITSTGSKSSGELSLDTLRIELDNTMKNRDILLAEKKSKLREISISIIEIEAKKWEIWTKIAETKMNEFLARDAIESDIIRAPYDGVILEKYMNVGTIIGQWIPLLRMTSEDKSILKAYIDNNLYEYEKWDAVEIENPVKNTTLTGTISLLQNERDPTHNKNYMEVTLSPSENVIGERMIIKLSRKKIPRENGTIIPVSALITRYGPAGVYIIEWEVVRFQLVEVLASDLIFAEVIGIREGATLITEWKENIYDWQVLARRETLSGE